MKITTAIILVAALHVNASSIAQKISFSGENVSLAKVFNAIEDQLGFGVLMPHNLMQSSRPVTVKIEGGTLDDLLEKCFEFQPWKLSYTITGHTIYISQADPPLDQPKDILAPGTNVKVTGSVFNESGEPLSGANVTIKETQKGTITDARGEFDLGSIPLGSTVIVSFIGYTSQVVKIKEEAAVKILLKVARSQLDRVVVQAYGTTSQRLTTGSIGVVTSEEIEKQPVVNPLEALQGRVPGLLVTEENGYASAPFKVEIRGRNSINGAFPSDPLYIIDGVPLTISALNSETNYAGGSTGFDQTGLSNSVGVGGQSPFFSLNPGDIESIEVLKDADATAIYGSRGANGVILITTKKGKAGKTKLDLNVYQGISAVTKNWDMMNTSQYLFMRRQALSNDGLAPSVGSDPDLLVWDTTRDENWQKYLWGNLGHVTDVQAALSGGDARTTFRISADYRHQTYITTVSGGDQRAAISFNLTHKGLNQRFSVQFLNNYSFAEDNLIGLSGDVTIAPDAPPVYDKLGYLNWSGWDPAESAYPFSNLLQPYTVKTNFLNSNLIGAYLITRGLSAKVSVGYNNMFGNGSLFRPIASQDPTLNPTGTAQFSTNINHSWIAEPQLEYNGYVSKGKLNVLVGGTDQSSYTEGDLVNGLGYTSDFLLRSVSNAPSVNSQSNSAEYKYGALFGRVNYNWENKYIANLSVRRDGSSRFAPGSQYGNFGSLGLAWIFSEEDWVKKTFPVLSFGKLRGSYGLTGADNIGDYAYASIWQSATPPYNGGTALTPVQFADSNYRWEVDKKAEVALDLGFLKDRITMEAAYYRNRCNNQLIAFPTPEFSGFNNVTANSPANVQNSGVEFLLNGTPVDSKNVKWTINFNIGINQNKLISYPNLAQSPFVNTYIIGYTLNFVRLLHYVGVDPQTGQYAYEDRNHDGVISTNPGPTDDRAPYNTNPKYFGGLNNTFTYKNFQLSFFIYFKKQIGENALNGEFDGTFNNNAPIVVLGHQWQYPGDKAAFARFTTQPQLSDGNFQESDGNYTDASYIRLKNLSLTYNLPGRILRKSGIQNMGIYLRTENLFVISNYQGLDPETQNFGGMPPWKTLTTGILATF
jgi:TonB-linked SusC/RagA family outer membrane protein